MNVIQRSRCSWKQQGSQTQTKRLCLRVCIDRDCIYAWNRRTGRTNRIKNLLVLHMSSTNGCMVQSQRKNYQFISCHTSPCSQLCGLPSYGRPRLRKRLFRKATWTSSNSHKILVHLSLWRLDSNPSSFQRRRWMTSSARLMSAVCRFACWGWTWGPAMSRDAAAAEWDVEEFQENFPDM